MADAARNSAERADLIQVEKAWRRLAANDEAESAVPSQRKSDPEGPRKGLAGMPEPIRAGSLGLGWA